MSDEELRQRLAPSFRLADESGHRNRRAEILTSPKEDEDDEDDDDIDPYELVDSFGDRLSAEVVEEFWKQYRPPDKDRTYWRSHKLVSLGLLHGPKQPHTQGRGREKAVPIIGRKCGFWPKLGQCGCLDPDTDFPWLPSEADEESDESETDEPKKDQPMTQPSAEREVILSTRPAQVLQQDQWQGQRRQQWQSNSWEQQQWQSNSSRDNGWWDAWAWQSTWQ